MRGHNLAVTPVAGEFDVPAIRERLLEAPDVLAGPLGENVFMVCGWPSSVPHHYHKRLTDQRFPYCLLATPSERQVLVSQEFADQDELRSGMEFLRWLTGQVPCRIREDGFADLTDQVREHLRRYHVRLLPSTLAHIRRNGYRIPPGVDVGMLRMVE